MGVSGFLNMYQACLLVSQSQSLVQYSYRTSHWWICLPTKSELSISTGLSVNKTPPFQHINAFPRVTVLLLRWVESSK